MTSAELRQLLQPMVNHITRLEVRLVQLEGNQPHARAVSDYRQQLESWDADAAARRAKAQALEAQWTRDVPLYPEQFERWQPRELFRVTRHVVRHLPNADGVVRPVAIVISSENMDEVELAQAEWEAHHPDWAEAYRRGPRAKVIVPEDGAASRHK
jgi:hypothetical protein